MIRAKFMCHFKDATSVYLHPVYCGSEENERFFEATPGGEIQLTVVNFSALEMFEVGKEYYVDFTPAEEGE